MQQKRESLANAHSNALALQQWSLKQPFSFCLSLKAAHLQGHSDAKQMHSTLHRTFFQSSIRMGSL